ncbi:MAG: peptidoglycan DD-metalloendopeptidase family protein, partial [Kamptonema sp. SIO4C4]|nr:peptidoglycan DD-metalloendopeptidase family protein [Kamptonema sp. SIO4C4]
MSQKRHNPTTFFLLLLRHALFTPSLTLIGGLTLLSGGWVWAQTDSFVDTGAAPANPPSVPKPDKAPTANTPASPPPQVSKPRVTVPSPAPAPQPASPPPVVTQPTSPPPQVNKPNSSPPRQPVANPNPSPSRPVATPQPSPTRNRPVATPQPSPTRNQPVARPSQPNITPPTVTVPAQRTGEIPEHLIDRPQEQSGRRATNQFIDPTPFNPRTATNNRSNESPSRTTANGSQGERPTVVLNERRTGCRTVVRNGRLASGSCSTTVAAQPPGQARGTQNPVTIPNQAVRSASNTRQIASAAPSSTGNSRSGRTRLKAIPVPSPQEMVALKNQLGERFSSLKNKIQEYGLERMAYPNNGNRALLFPLPIAAQITSAFGQRLHPIFGDWRMHTGTDIAAPLGTPVLAAFHGEVAIADYVGGYGNMVVLRHEDSTQESRYAHLKQILVKPGQWVEQGQVIGLVGSTGNSTGAHLHFEWRHHMAEGWIPVDAGPHLEWAMTAM